MAILILDCVNHLLQTDSNVIASVDWEIVQTPFQSIIPAINCFTHAKQIEGDLNGTRFKWYVS